jgi:hypothetical protein
MDSVPPFVVTDDKSFVRDTHNRALLNTDRAALDRHRAARSKSASLTQKLATLEHEVSELKALVHALLSKS